MKHRTTTTILLVLSCFALSPMTQAVTPAPDGGYSGGNTAEGANALFSLTTGTHNTAVGARSLYSNTTSYDNTAVGWRALYKNTNAPVPILNGPGGSNTAIGAEALYHNNGSGNTAVGWRALESNTTGGNNIALGDGAGYALTTGDFNIDIGNVGAADEANTIRIGTPFQGVAGFSSGQSRTFVAGIRGVTTDNDDAIPVVIDSAGQLGTTASSERFKTEIKPMDKASEAILSLKPVTFHYNNQKSNVTGTPQFGLIAEDVGKVNPDLVVRNKNGEIYTVRYDAVNAMLLNEFLKEHHKVEEQDRKLEEQEATIAELKKGMDILTASLKEQEAQIQKMSDQLAVASPSRGGLEVSKPARQMVSNNQ